MSPSKRSIEEWWQVLPDVPIFRWNQNSGVLNKKPAVRLQSLTGIIDYKIRSEFGEVKTGKSGHHGINDTLIQNF